MTFNVRLVIFGLLTSLILSIVGIVSLSMTNHTVDDILKQIAIGSLTALAGILAKTTPDDPAPIVVQAPAEVEVKPAAKK